VKNMLHTRHKNKEKARMNKRIIVRLYAAAVLILLSGNLLAADPGNEYERLVIFGPNLAEIVYKLGGEDFIIAVDSFTDYPPSLKELPRSGTLSHPNLEVIVEEEADLVMIQGDNQKLRDFCRKQGIAYRVYRLEGVAGIKEGIMDIGRLLDREARAREFVDSLNKKCKEQEKPEKRNRPGILITLSGLSPEVNVTTVGKNTFLSELLEKAGGENVFADIGIAYPRVTMEKIMVRNPEMIFEIMPGKELSDKERHQRKKFWQRFPSLQAVRNDEIHFLTEDFLLIPGPRIGQTYEVFQKQISEYQGRKTQGDR